MRRALRLALPFLFVVCSLASWVLETNKDRVTPGSTKDVELVCTKDYSSSEGNDKIQAISRIRITRYPLDAKSKVTFVAFRVGTNKMTFEDEDIKVTSQINTKGVTFLKVTWPTATKSTPDLYGCDVDGLDKNDNFASLHVTPKRIEQHMFSPEDAKTLIKSEISGYVKNQQRLESEIVELRTILSTQTVQSNQQYRGVVGEIGSLKTFVNRQLKEIQRQHRVDIEKLRSEMALRMTLHNESYYASKDELSGEISNVKNFFSDELSNHCKAHNHSDLDSKFDKAINDFEEKLTQLESKLSQFEFRMTNKFNTIGRQRNASIKVDGTDTKATVWPDGTYALVRPQSGCPGFKKVQTLTYQRLFVPYEDADLKYFHFPKFQLHLDEESRELKLCLNNKSKQPHYPPNDWPQGSYCLNMVGGKCPYHFQPGRMKYRIQDDRKDVGFLPVSYCCRSDGNPDVPIHLPRDRPFYLYRNQGRCQRVQGMNMKDDYVTLGSKEQHPDISSLTGFNPDTSKIGYPIYLCYYFP